MSKPAQKQKYNGLLILHDVPNFVSQSSDSTRHLTSLIGMSTLLQVATKPNA